MQISSRFTIALHIFTCVDVFKDECKVTSDFLAGSINTNPVIIRKILTQLKNALPFLGSLISPIHLLNKFYWLPCKGEAIQLVV